MQVRLIDNNGHEVLRRTVNGEQADYGIISYESRMFAFQRVLNDVAYFEECSVVTWKKSYA